MVTIFFPADADSEREDADSERDPSPPPTSLPKRSEATCAEGALSSPPIHNRLRIRGFFATPT